MKAPVIGFSASVINTVAGAHCALVFEAEDDCDEVEVVQTWSEGAVDRQGRLTEGVHTLTLTASDLSGNSTEKVVTVNVKASLE